MRITEALVQSQRNIALALVVLYKALGGGWEGPPLLRRPCADAVAGNGLRPAPTQSHQAPEGPAPMRSRQLTDQYPDVAVEQP
jgi:hypothetical protein